MDVSHLLSAGTPKFRDDQEGSDKVAQPVTSFLEVFKRLSGAYLLLK